MPSTIIMINLWALIAGLSSATYVTCDGIFDSQHMDSRLRLWDGGFNVESVRRLIETSRINVARRRRKGKKISPGSGNAQQKEWLRAEIDFEAHSRIICFSSFQMHRCRQTNGGDRWCFLYLDDLGVILGGGMATPTTRPLEPTPHSSKSFLAFALGPKAFGQEG